MIGLSLYSLAAPAVHVAHGRPLVGLLDFGLRTVAPAIPVIAWTAACDGELRSEGCVVAAGGSALVVGIAAIIVDAVVLARKDVPVTKASAGEASEADDR